ncbi:FadR family transcriptional regulator [Leucobacter sp. UCMA 4100]|uniref:FadR/GntR family transcriptional regulator n=1 Tax=Leucobacter sp. UCMA 4100 TaxID=2810534 RepID=UPI0022EB5644|nr:FCD domain-containing protein [Leucobacter sp. UCMA 4100]MDA3146364.1 FadR family transcriptional regulator [Leucobacter sp. UCMA 4100]
MGISGLLPATAGQDHELYDPTLSAISRLSAIDTVRARIIMAIKLGLLQPGEKLPHVDDMAEAFTVSRSSVIRGLATLQESEIIERKAGRYGGSFVCAEPNIDLDHAVDRFVEDTNLVRSLIDERAVLEAGFVALAVQHLTKGHLAQLESLVQRMRDTTDWAQFRNLDREFHMSIARIASVSRAIPLLQYIHEALDPYFLPYKIEYLYESNEEHQGIINALRDGDSALAATLTVAHVQDLHDSMFIGDAHQPGLSSHTVARPSRPQ